MVKKIGIIGSGIVGQTLANGFIKHNYDVMIGTNTPGKYEELKNKTNGKAKVVSFSEVATFGEILVLATKGPAAESIVRSIAGSLNGKTILDATNPIAEAPPVNGVIQYFTKMNESLMERLQSIATGANFVKAFSSIGSAWMVNPDFGGIKPTMFICGNDEKAKGEAKAILTQFGFEPEDMGTAEAARAIEPLAMLWCIPGFRQNSWSHAFKLLKK